MTPNDFPPEVLDKLKLDKLFRDCADYNLECAEKLQLYKEEKLIKPLYEESHEYIQEIKTILYYLLVNKNLDLLSREVFYNYLCFDKDHATTIKAFFKNMKDKFTSMLTVDTRQDAEHLLHRQQRK